MTLQACAELVARGDPDRFRATMAAPLAARAVLFPLYAFNIEVSRAPWVTAEPMIAEMRLQFWRDVIEELAAGKAPRAHEVVAPLAKAVPQDLIGALDALVTARRWDIYTDPFEDRGGFDAYLMDTAATLVTIPARALGAPAEAEGVLRDAGWAFGLASFLRAIPALEAAGRVPLIEGTPQAVRDLAAEGLARLARARAGRRLVPRSAAPALYAGWKAEGILRAARDIPERVIEGKLDGSEFAARLGLMRVAMTGRW
ncbi:squalene/phytoene synthase family protein [Roseicyclus mahoneyensis]|uniref:Phytoene/squalene synthetase n=1 Tax=Roseicyclus mahoneyensis TaxID=164332 RepID=A0A316GNX6_9RHOB|nr:squalene/phytoene synthase family protein [Roseicyclus mahoneyensis]PWK62594.1 phytoene/squalene synthetase [Roseicyclus mahoneyensis]